MCFFFYWFLVGNDRTWYSWHIPGLSILKFFNTRLMEMLKTLKHGIPAFPSRNFKKDFCCRFFSRVILFRSIESLLIYDSLPSTERFEIFDAWDFSYCLRDDFWLINLNNWIGMAAYLHNLLVYGVDSWKLERLFSLVWRSLCLPREKKSHS